MENPIKMDDLGVPLFSETAIWFLVVPVNPETFHEDFIPPNDLFNENQVQDVPVERSNMWCEDPGNYSRSWLSLERLALKTGDS